MIVEGVKEVESEKEKTAGKKYSEQTPSFSETRCTD